MAQANRSRQQVLSRRYLLAVYMVNATLVICHEIDSAYWHEWDLFRIPGGASVFVALHLLLVPLILLGLLQIAAAAPSARTTALVIGLAGLAGFLAHATFLLSGDERFRTPFSVALMAAFGLSSTLLVLSVVLARGIRPDRSRWTQGSAGGDRTGGEVGPRSAS